MISGDDILPYAELTWQNLNIGGIEFRVNQYITISSRQLLQTSYYCHIYLQQDSMCERCKMVNIDQDTSDMYCKPLSILAQHKKQGKSVFGIFITCDDTQKRKIRVGQQCIVSDKKI